MASLHERWDREARRLEGYLIRNYKLAHGIAEEDLIELDGEEIARPVTAESLRTTLKKAMSDRTPTMEREVQLGDEMREDEKDDHSDYGDEDEGGEEREGLLSEKLGGLDVDDALHRTTRT